MSKFDALELEPGDEVKHMASGEIWTVVEAPHEQHIAAQGEVVIVPVERHGKRTTFTHRQLADSAS